MWVTIILLMCLVSVPGLYWLSRRVAEFGFIKNRFDTTRKARLFALLVIVALFAVFDITLGLMNGMIIFLHTLVIWAISDFAAFIYRKIKKVKRTKYISGLAAIITTVCYLSVGVFFAFYVFRTEYNFKTDKPLPNGNLKIVGFSDSHIGVTFSSNGFKKQLERLNREKADMFVIVGDFIDDSTTKEEMEKSCKALKGLKSKYGTFYVFGNHDAGYMGSERRGYSRDDLINNLKKNGVTVLEDNAVTLQNKITVIGRADGGHGNRLAADELITGKENTYTVFLDHVPGDYESEAKAGADLVLSGHTHGGQLIPINRVGELIGVNDATYGHEKRNNTDFVVSSGISNWELYFKTGCISEYFVINIKSK